MNCLLPGLQLQTYHIWYFPGPEMLGIYICLGNINRFPSQNPKFSGQATSINRLFYRLLQYIPFIRDCRLDCVCIRYFRPFRYKKALMSNFSYKIRIKLDLIKYYVDNHYWLIALCRNSYELSLKPRWTLKMKQTFFQRVFLIISIIFTIFNVHNRFFTDRVIIKWLKFWIIKPHISGPNVFKSWKAIKLPKRVT